MHEHMGRERVEERGDKSCNCHSKWLSEYAQTKTMYTTNKAYSFTILNANSNWIEQCVYLDFTLSVIGIRQSGLLA
jgi:hypothetical protein